MKQCLAVNAWLIGALLVSMPAGARDRGENAETMIKSASGVLFDRTSSQEQIRDALILLLDAALVTLPQTGSAADARSDLEAARGELKSVSIFSEKGYQRLSLAYRALNSGRSFQLPDRTTVHSIDEAKAHIQKLLTGAVASLKYENAGQTSKLLVESVIMVVTPIPK